jgi:predicted MFS family arabinose efflux permease
MPTRNLLLASLPGPRALHSSGHGRTDRSGVVRPGRPGEPATAEPASPAVPRSAWARPAAAILVVGWGANMFASLLQVYRGHLSGVQVNGLFGAYAVGLVPALLIMARVSDSLGRRRMLLAALLLSALGSAVILSSGGAFETILAGRILVGISAGAAIGPGTAWIKELSDAGNAPGVGARRAAVALTAGFAAGPLLSGAIVQWFPSPETASYLVHIALVVLALPITWRAPEMSRRHTGPDSSRTAAGRPLKQVLTTRIFLAVILPTAPWVFGTATVALAALPVLVPLGHYAPAGSGLVAATTLGTGILIQPWARRLARCSPAAPFMTGMAAAVSGMLAAALTVATGSPVLLFATAVILGSAYGLLLVSGLQLVESLTRPENIATAVAVFYALTYIGFAFPVLVQALSSLWSPVTVLLTGSALAAAGLTTTFLAWPPRRTPRTRP